MRSRSVLSVCAFLMCCSVANADPITVTSGSIAVMGNTGGIAFSLLGDGLALQAIADSDSRVDPRFCSPCTATQALSFGARLSDFHGAGPGTVNGTYYPTLFLEGFLDVTGATVPNALANGLTVTAPFTMTAPLRGYARDNIGGNGGPVLFTVTLIAHGTATANFSSVPVNPGFPPLFMFHDVMYRFESTPSPTPEPATLVMLGTGLAGLVMRSRSRRR